MKLHDGWCLRSSAAAKLPNEVTPAKILTEVWCVLIGQVAVFDVHVFELLDLPHAF